jgi:hypothetical protein
MTDKELIIRAFKGLEVYDLMPTHALEGDFPHSYVHNYVHWIHRGSSVIEWRPLESKWISSPENWRISTPEDAYGSTLALNNRRLVDPASETAKAVHRWLKPLESSSHINIYFNEHSGKTEVHLPRTNLDFILHQAGLESKQFRGMIVDPNQYIGTLLGLQQKLALKDAKGPSRIVIVPHGSVSYHQIDHQYVRHSLLGLYTDFFVVCKSLSPLGLAAKFLIIIGLLISNLGSSSTMAI